MTPSQACAALIHEFEGCKLKAYQDPGGIWTIGWGHVGPEVHQGLIWTQDQADEAMQADMIHKGVGVTSLINGSPTTQNQFDALTDFAYNLGLGNLGSSTLLKMHRASQYAEVEQQFGRWIHQGSQVLEGLVKRRAAEAALYRGQS